MTVIENDGGVKLAEKKFKYMQSYFNRPEWRNIRTKKEMQVKLESSHELDSMFLVGKGCNFVLQGVIGSITLLNRPILEKDQLTSIRLGRVISLFINGVLETYRIDCEGKARLI